MLRAGAPAAGGRGTRQRRRARGARLPWGRARPAVRRAMDFNMKKLASDAGIFFTRAVQVRLCALGPARPAPGARMWDGPGALLQQSPGCPGEPLSGRRSIPRFVADTSTSPTLVLPRRKRPRRPAKPHPRRGPRLGTEPGLGPVACEGAIGVHHFDPPRYSPALAPAQGPSGDSAEEGRGHQAVPASLPLSSGDSGSQQAFGGASPRPEDSCIRHDLFSEPQSPHLCSGLVVP